MPRKYSYFYFIPSFLLLFFPFSLNAAPNSLFLNQAQPQHIYVHNRILAKVNNKPISVVDLMKKMDMFFYRQYPQFATSVEARFQFYQMNWRLALQEMVDKELILADALENKVPITQGDIRKEMETLFGPNIIANLDKAGLTHEEASQMVKEDLTIKRTLYARVHSKVVRAVTPQKVRSYYETWAKKNTKPSLWKYQVISIRGKESTACAETAHYAHRLLTEEQIPLSSLEEKLKNDSIGDQTSCTVSDLFEHTQKEISEAYKGSLEQLKPNCFSSPLLQKSRTGEVFRLFYLKEKIEGGAPPLQAVENELRDELTDQESKIEGDIYMARIRKHFVTQIFVEKESANESFQPFSLE